MFPCPLLILAGGKATRLGSLVADTPKFLMKINEKRCFADLQLEWAKNQGFHDVILCVGHLGKKIEAYCGDGSRYGLRIRYSDDGPVPLGTGGAIKNALPVIQGPVAVTYGDTILALNCKDIFELSQKSGGLAFMTLFKNSVPGHTCNASIDGNKVHYSKTSPRKDFEYIDYGFLCLSPSFLKSLPSNQAIDLAEPLEAASRTGELYGSVVDQRFWEMGSPDSYEEFKKRFASKS